jgi:hypothetical protein
VSKIADALKELREAAACKHEFEYLREHPHGNGIVGRCVHCKCRFTAWPGTAHYDEIVAARDASNKETG